MLSDILKGLCALHSANIIHGAVHPNNVFIDTNGRALLAEYDFSKSVVIIFFNNLSSVNARR